MRTLTWLVLVLMVGCGGEEEPLEEITFEQAAPASEEGAKKLAEKMKGNAEPKPIREPSLDTIGLVEFELHGKNISAMAYEYWGFIKNIGDVDLENVYIKIGGPKGSEMNELGFYRPTSIEDNSLPVGDSTRLEYLFYKDGDSRPGTWTAQVWDGDDLVAIAGRTNATLLGTLRFMSWEEQAEITESRSPGSMRDY